MLKYRESASQHVCHTTHASFYDNGGVVHSDDFNTIVKASMDKLQADMMMMSVVNSNGKHEIICFNAYFRWRCGCLLSYSKTIGGIGSIG